MRADWWVPSPWVTAPAGWFVITRPLPLSLHLVLFNAPSLRSQGVIIIPLYLYTFRRLKISSFDMRVALTPPVVKFIVCHYGLLSLVKNHRTAKSILSARVVSKLKPVNWISFYNEWTLGSHGTKFVEFFFSWFWSFLPFPPGFSISEGKWISYAHMTM